MFYSQVNQKMCYLHCLAIDIPLWPISAHTRYCWLVSFSQPQNTPNGQLLFIWYEQIHKILIVQDYQLFTNLKFWVITKTNDWRVNCVTKTTSFHVISSEQVTTPHTNTHTQTYTHTHTNRHTHIQLGVCNRWIILKVIVSLTVTTQTTTSIYMEECMPKIVWNGITW